jgi:molybdate transport system substrate-binding protein
MKLMMSRLVAACLAMALAACDGETQKSSQRGAPEPIVVAAASSLTNVMEEIGALYAAAGHPEPRFSFAATSELVRQIEQGAQVDVFVSADTEWMDYLAEKTLVDPASRKDIAANTLVLIAPAGKSFSITIGPGMNLRAVLGDGRIAIANPDGVPAGKYARDALQAFGAWNALEGVAARTENVRAALRFVEVGEAAAGIVYETDAIAAADKVVIVGKFPPSSHAPILYPAATVSGGDSQGGRDFLDFLATEAATRAFAGAGFGPPQ